MASSPANPRGNSGRHFPVHWPTREYGNQSEIVFVTVCTQSRKRILNSDEAVATIVKAWEEANTWLVGRYVILPDHIHLFCSPNDHRVSVKRWAQFWKSRASQHWPQPSQQPIWQRDCWDVQLRRDESYAAKWDYVRNNPVRHGLAAKAEDWPWAGEMTALMWHEP